jgi:hypothetical protein
MRIEAAGKATAKGAVKGQVCTARHCASKDHPNARAVLSFASKDDWRRRSSHSNLNGDLKHYVSDLSSLGY